MTMKKGKMTIKASQMFALLLVLTASLLVCSCKTKKCQQEYSQLSVMEFHSLDSANLAMGAFLDEFNGNKRCLEYCTKVTQMKNMFGEMRDLFSDVDDNLPQDRYCAFVSMTKSNNSAYRECPYETVRLTWNYLVGKKKDIYAKERLDWIEESEFRPKLMNYAEKLAEQWFHKFRVESAQILNGKVDMDVVVDKLEKHGSCEVLVNMGGNFLKENGPVHRWVPGVYDYIHKTGTVKIKVEGTFRLSTSSCEVSFFEGDCEMLECSGDLLNEPWHPNINVNVGRRRR